MNLTTVWRYYLNSRSDRFATRLHFSCEGAREKPVMRKYKLKLHSPSRWGCAGLEQAASSTLVVYLPALLTTTDENVV